MRFYGMSFKEVSQLTLKAFWMISNEIVRLQAYEDKRAVEVALAGQGGENAQKVLKNLTETIGEIVKKKQTGDGLDALRNLKRKMAAGG